MKKILLLVLVGGLAVAFVSRVLAPWAWVRAAVDRTAVAHDPAAIAMKHQESPLVHFTVLPDLTHAGLVHLPDGEKVKFWFRSHHLSGVSCTRFDFADGSREYFKGCFCCEVMLPEDKIRSKGDLMAFLQANHGTKP